MRLYKESDYLTLVEWWIDQKWNNILLPEMLPKTGLIEDGVCAMFLYKSDSSIAWIGFPIANPKSDKNVRNQALNDIINGLIELGKEDGYKQIFTTSNIPKLIDRYKNLGFGVGDENVLQLIKKV